MDRLDYLESNSIHIFREAFNQLKKPGMLWSPGSATATRRNGRSTLSRIAARISAAPAKHCRQHRALQPEKAKA